ncbi:MAG: hypothetical protein R2851_16300 [Caldilineaceae bacterium]
MEHTGQIPPDAFKLMSVAGACAAAMSNPAPAHLRHGVAQQKKLKAHLEMLEEAKKRDHRKAERAGNLHLRRGGRPWRACRSGCPTARY